MSHTLTVELSDEVYAAIQRQVEEANTSPAQLATLSLAQHFGRGHHARQTTSLRTEAELQAARERFERHFGAVNLGYATGADNESIDADLAREYINNHEEG